MDRIPQGGATSSFGERRNITTGMLRSNVSDIGPSSEICFPMMNEREVTRSYFIEFYFISIKRFDIKSSSK